MSKLTLTGGLPLKTRQLTKVHRQPDTTDLKFKVSHTTQVTGSYEAPTPSVEMGTSNLTPMDSKVIPNLSISALTGSEGCQ